MIKQLIRLDLFAFDSWTLPSSPKLLTLNLSKGIIYSMNICLTLFLINRWLVSGHFPLSNLYESLMFLSWSFTMIFIITSSFVVAPTLHSSSAVTAAQHVTPGVKEPMVIFTWSVLPITLLTCAYAVFCIPPDLQKASNLVPALESNWLIMHVSVMILSYASLLIGSLFALSLMWVTKPIFLDNLSYRFIGLGFALLTLGIISGAVWANSAWGSYWSWDPKETWAFITWLTYAIYLHLRITKGWYGKQAAGVAVFGFFVVWFCYLGVNLFGKGLHSYAFV